jgi:hypothetical protein
MKSWKFLPESMAPAADHERDLPLGELLARAGLVAPNELYAALATARASGQRLGDLLVEQGLVNERDLAIVVAEQEGSSSSISASMT